mmetsp:Transcript_108805/g.314184  ORF Transcript_108805/g.314184 Transcript_108805/m.314184 type:complete len:387 (-) Transcript_108805:9-1169(-)
MSGPSAAGPRLCLERPEVHVDVRDALGRLVLRARAAAPPRRADDDLGRAGGLVVLANEERAAQETARPRTPRVREDEHAAEKLHRGPGDARASTRPSSFENTCLRANLVQHGFGCPLRRQEGQTAAEQGVHAYAQGPDVDLTTVPLTGDQFRRHVRQRARHPEQLWLVDGGDLPRAAEVADRHCDLRAGASMGHHDKIVGLQVSVYDIGLVNGGHAPDHVSRQRPQEPLADCRLAENVLRERALCSLHHDVRQATLQEEIQACDDVLARGELLHDGSLSHGETLAIAVEFALLVADDALRTQVDDLDCEALGATDGLRCVHRPKPAGAKLARQDILLMEVSSIHDCGSAAGADRGVGHRRQVGPRGVATHASRRAFLEKVNRGRPR